jgi:hypothetical protein
MKRSRSLLAIIIFILLSVNVVADFKTVKVTEEEFSDVPIFTPDTLKKAIADGQILAVAQDNKISSDIFYSTIKKYPELLDRKFLESSFKKGIDYIAKSGGMNPKDVEFNLKDVIRRDNGAMIHPLITRILDDGLSSPEWIKKNPKLFAEVMKYFGVSVSSEDLAKSTLSLKRRISDYDSKMGYLLVGSESEIALDDKQFNGLSIASDGSINIEGIGRSIKGALVELIEGREKSDPDQVRMFRSLKSLMADEPIKMSASSPPTGLVISGELGSHMGSIDKKISRIIRARPLW